MPTKTSWRPEQWIWRRVTSPVFSFILNTWDLVMKVILKMDVQGVPSPCCHRQSSTNGLSASWSQPSLLLVFHLVWLLQLSSVVVWWSSREEQHWWIKSAWKHAYSLHQRLAHAPCVSFVQLSSQLSSRFLSSLKHWISLPLHLSFERTKGALSCAQPILYKWPSLANRR